MRSNKLTIPIRMELIDLVIEHGFDTVVLPRPGCGNGGLRWQDVRPLLGLSLDDRFIVVDNGSS